MRKEVKLGMALGGGLVALLVAYLIVAPPSDNKRGAQLATGDVGSIIDAPAGGEGEAAAATAMPVVDTKAATAAGAHKNDVAAPQAEQPKAPARAEDKPAAGTGRDPWKVLDNGSKESGVKPAKPQQLQGASLLTVTPPTGSNFEQAQPKEAPKAPERREPTVASNAPAGGTPSRRAVYIVSDPHAPYGGGLSTDGLTASADRALDGVEEGGQPAKAQPTAPEPAAAAKADLGSTAAVPTAGATHVVRSGETFSSIAQAVYGSAAYYPHLIRANPHANPNNLKLGTAIVIPKVDDVKATGAGERPKAALTVVDDVKIDPTKQYKVQAGDSLYKISQKVYGRPTYLEAIYEKNRQLIGPNPTKLKLGMILELPEKAGAVPAPEAALGGGTSGAVNGSH